MRRLLFLFPIAFVLSSCDSSTTPTYETTTIIGKIGEMWLDGGTKEPPYDSVTVHLLNANGGGYRETATTTGFWAFRKVLNTSYIAYAERPGFGRSEDVAITEQNPTDTVWLRLALQPTVKPVLDSIVGSWDSGYRFYARMTPEASEKIDLLVRPAGTSDDHFGILLDFTTVVQGDEDQYIIYVKKQPSWLPSDPEFAVEAYNPSVGYYNVYASQWRRCSEGPLSNVMRPR